MGKGDWGLFMAKGNVTLKQIAEVAGVSTTTVHRVLNGKEGYGEELKEKILGIARELGYSVNVSASSLRKKTSHIALVFPSSNCFSRFFMGHILDGYRRYQQQMLPCNVQFHEFFYDYDDPESMCPILKRISLDDPVHFDGIALWGNTTSGKVVAMLNRLQGKGVPVVMLERSPADPDLYDCCVGPDDQLVGAMAGELLSKLTRPGGRVLIITQDLGYPDPNGTACIRELAAQGRTDLEPVVLPLPMLNINHTDAVKAALQENPDIAAVYSTCARHTLAYICACRDLKVKPSAAVGSELFDESIAALEDGTLSALVNKCPHTIGHQALRLLFDCVVKNERLPREYRVMPLIVLKANRFACQDY